MNTRVKRNSAGFTIIELMVVISVIATISSTILASLSSARIKGVNARLIEETLQLRNKFELGWNGSSYGDFSPAAASPSNSGIPYGSVIAPNTFANSDINILINDILSYNNGVYGGGTAVPSTSSCPGITTQVYPAAYTPASTATLNTNGMTIYVYPACGPVTKYAIFTSLAPIKISMMDNFVNTALADGPALGTFSTTLNARNYAGFYCVDSSGKTTSANYGWIPGFRFSADGNIYMHEPILDGECHVPPYAP